MAHYRSFLPQYDFGYLPPAGSRCWLPMRETMPARDRERAVLERRKDVSGNVCPHSRSYRRKWEEAADHPDHRRSLEDFEPKVLVVTKRDLLESPERAPRISDYLYVDDAEVDCTRASSGTTGRPTVFAMGRDDWDAITNPPSASFGASVRAGETVFVAAIFSLYVDSLGMLCGFERLPAKAFLFGANSPVITARAAMWVSLMKPSAFYTMPSFAVHLTQVTRAEGLDPMALRLETMFVSSDPGASMPASAT
jgi:phenylacetate-CoA ligase